MAIGCALLAVSFLQLVSCTQMDAASRKEKMDTILAIIQNMQRRDIVEAALNETENITDTHYLHEELEQILDDLNNKCMHQYDNYLRVYTNELDPNLLHLWILRILRKNMHMHIDRLSIHLCNYFRQYKGCNKLDPVVNILLLRCMLYLAGVLKPKMLSVYFPLDVSSEVLEELNAVTSPQAPGDMKPVHINLKYLNIRMSSFGSGKEPRSICLAKYEHDFTPAMQVVLGMLEIDFLRTLVIDPYHMDLGLACDFISRIKAGNSTAISICIRLEKIVHRERRREYSTQLTAGWVSGKRYVEYFDIQICPLEFYLENLARLERHAETLSVPVWILEQDKILLSLPMVFHKKMWDKMKAHLHNVLRMRIVLYSYRDMATIERDIRQIKMEEENRIEERAKLQELNISFDFYNGPFDSITLVPSTEYLIEQIEKILVWCIFVQPSPEVINIDYSDQHMNLLTNMEFLKKLRDIYIIRWGAFPQDAVPKFVNIHHQSMLCKSRKKDSELLNKDADEYPKNLEDRNFLVSDPSALQDLANGILQEKISAWYKNDTTGLGILSPHNMRGEGEQGPGMSEQEAEKNPSCPVCYSDVLSSGMEMYLTPCRHAICLECIKSICQDVEMKHENEEELKEIACPYCRSAIRVNMVCYRIETKDPEKKEPGLPYRVVPAEIFTESIWDIELNRVLDNTEAEEEDEVWMYTPKTRT